MAEIQNDCSKVVINRETHCADVTCGCDKRKTTFTACCGQDLSENGANNETHLRYSPDEECPKKYLQFDVCSPQ